MNSYRVEVITGESVESRHVANAGTPWEAAEKATGRAIQARTNERTWVRVTDETRRSVFKSPSSEPIASPLKAVIFMNIAIRYQAAVQQFSEGCGSARHPLLKSPIVERGNFMRV